VPKDAEEEKYFVPVSLSVRNTSEVRDTDVTLPIRYDKASQRKSIPEEFMVHSGSRLASELSHEINGNEQYDYVNYRIKFLTSDGSFTYSEGAFASRMATDSQLPPLLTSGDGMNIQATTFSEKDGERKWDIRYRGIRVSNNQGIEWYLRNWYAKYVALETRRQSSFFAYLRGLLFSGDVTAYGFSPDFKLIPQLNLYLPQSQPKNYIGVKFDPYVWSLLFDSGR
jgi:hypothetical protein